MFQLYAELKSVNNMYTSIFLYEITELNHIQTHSQTSSECVLLLGKYYIGIGIGVQHLIREEIVGYCRSSEGSSDCSASSLLQVFALLRSKFDFIVGLNGMHL